MFASKTKSQTPGHRQTKLRHRNASGGAGRATVAVPDVIVRCDVTVLQAEVEQSDSAAKATIDTVPPAALSAGESPAPGPRSPPQTPVPSTPPLKLVALELRFRRDCAVIVAGRRRAAWSGRNINV